MFDGQPAFSLHGECSLPISFSHPRRVRIHVMVRLWIGHKFSRSCLITILMYACASLVVAQQPTKMRPSSVPRQIILPPNLVAGAQATLAVIDYQGRLLPNITVEVSGGEKVTTDVTGRALFNAPGDPGALVARISGQAISASATVTASDEVGAQTGSEGGAATAKIISYPHILAIHDRFTLQGSGFRGAPDLNHVSLNGDPCLVVAASQVSLVILPGPRAPVGDATLKVSVAGTDSGSFPVSAVLLEFSGPAGTPDAGTTGSLTLRARGTTEPLTVEIRNGSPAVIQLSKGNVQRLKTSGGEQNAAPIEVKFLTGGNYAVSARLVSVDRR